ncbi:MAG: AbrB/MazE/SpoVT family DNA-binding domain-containing protein [Deltaproteobacteria bacterium]|nr:AbrB/MazE/SpoVT family DNA-binding domain-containing protein [Deltaproteobacteria bacterium]MBI5810863.1 AbrB/MazE/SpoVT family DNA-binding domain-containing protein [Deltaproteobacteria bacterium]
MPTRVVKITSKGQATIPKEIRDLLKTDVVEFDVIEGAVVVKPVLSVGGALSRYSKGYVPLKDIRETVWEEVAHERPGKKTA